MIWDSKNLSAPLITKALDNAAGVIMPFYDEDSEVLFFAGKGDGAIRYYEIAANEEPNQIVNEISSFRSNDPTSGCGAIYRRSCNVSVNEIIRLYQVTGTQLRPLSFQVPRKSDLFQDDLFPDCRGDQPNLALDAWLKGENATPKLVSLEGGFKVTEKKEKTLTKVAESAAGSASGDKAKFEELTRRVAFLEAEIAKRDVKIKELEG